MTLEQRLEQRCRQVWSDWLEQPEDVKAYWRARYRPVIEAEMKAEERRP